MYILEGVGDMRMEIWSRALGKSIWERERREREEVRGFKGREEGEEPFRGSMVELTITWVRGGEKRMNRIIIIMTYSTADDAYLPLPLRKTTM